MFLENHIRKPPAQLLKETTVNPDKGLALFGNIWHRVGLDIVGSLSEIKYYVGILERNSAHCHTALSQLLLVML